LVTEDAPIVITTEQEKAAHHHDSSIKTLTFELDVLGGAATFYVNVIPTSAQLSDLVVPARMLATKLSGLLLDGLRKKGEYVPCRKGCSSCCSYLVPLSIPEVFRLREEVSAMPSDRQRAILQKSLKAAGRILNCTPKDSEGDAAITGNGREELDRLSLWYSGLELPCPFLRNHLCDYYEQRPIACREHMVVGIRSCCGDNSGKEPSVVRIPASILECLGKLTAELEQRDVEAIMLPLALPWAQENLDRSRRTWPAVTMVERFIEILTALHEQKRPVQTQFSLIDQQRQLSLC